MSPSPVDSQTSGQTFMTIFMAIFVATLDCIAPSVSMLINGRLVGHGCSVSCGPSALSCFGMELASSSNPRVHSMQDRGLINNVPMHLCTC